ncbi:MAG TPA: hypothetical protein PLQ82_09640 [Desulfobacteraceae bacterium]|nr:hypothetical protein [Desulfobacteraceae bacterium]HPQ28730.1 hypothetical protein [Desulfobacteraceae bacterium]
MQSSSLNQKWLTSKEILQLTGISRATLNNYIKMNILPRPVVQKPVYKMKGTKRIGYFPFEVLDRIELVKSLKAKGGAMEDIVKDLKTRRYDQSYINVTDNYVERSLIEENETCMKHGKEISLTFTDLQHPAYLLGYDFHIKWLNNEAEGIIFRQQVNEIKDSGRTSIFKLFFHWEFHDIVKNWRDLVFFHMGFVKALFSREHISELYNGISNREINVLEEIYDMVTIHPKTAIRDSVFHLLMKDGTTELYRIYSMKCKEGLFFIYRKIEPGEMWER